MNKKPKMNRAKIRNIYGQSCFSGFNGLYKVEKWPEKRDQRVDISV